VQLAQERALNFVQNAMLTFRSVDDILYSSSEEHKESEDLKNG
jgi:ubiquinone biosynthesis protein COQ9